jgi:hypothetical protein
VQGYRAPLHVLPNHRDESLCQCEAEDQLGPYYQDLRRISNVGYGLVFTGTNLRGESLKEGCRTFVPYQVTDNFNTVNFGFKVSILYPGLDSI